MSAKSEQSRATCAADFHAEIGEHFVGGALERRAADNRADGHHRRFRAFEQTA